MQGPGTESNHAGSRNNSLKIGRMEIRSNLNIQGQGATKPKQTELRSRSTYTDEVQKQLYQNKQS